jgi:hypothetical protein
MGSEAPGKNNRFEDFDGRNLAFPAGLKIHFLQPLDPQAADWEAQKEAYGLRIAREIADQAVPRLMEQLGVTGGEVPGSGVKTQGSLQCSGRIDDLGGGIMAVEQKFNMDVRLQSDFAMSAGEIIFAARDNIASDVASFAVFLLEQRFEGKQSFDTNTEISRENGEIVGFKRTETPPPAPEGEPALAA